MKTRTDESILRTENLSFMDFIRYTDMTIPKGKTTCITGESGTGKSTLLRLFNNSLSPSSGSIFYRESDIFSLDPVELRRSVLLVSQSVFLFDDTIGKNFSRFFTYRDEPVPEKSVIQECLAVCRAEFSLDTDCSKMSGGERQRVYLALYLAMDSDILMLDEPTSALDAANGRNVMKNIVEFCLKRDRTPVVVSHDENLVERFGEHRVVLAGKESA